jgi:hypothetical protein
MERAGTSHHDVVQVLNVGIATTGEVGVTAHKAQSY